MTTNTLRRHRSKVYQEVGQLRGESWTIECWCGYYDYTSNRDEGRREKAWHDHNYNERDAETVAEGGTQNAESRWPIDAFYRPDSVIVN